MDNGEKKLSASMAAEKHACPEEEEIQEQATEDGFWHLVVHHKLLLSEYSIPRNTWALLPIKSISIFSLLSQYK